MESIANYCAIIINTIIHNMNTEVNTNYFNALVTWLEENWSGFRLSTLAEQLGCSTESIRRWRIGMGTICTPEILALKKHYQANPLFLLEGIGPMRLTGDVTVVMEPGAAYNSEVNKTIADLENKLRDKERIIQLYEKAALTTKKPRS